jgi:predicted DNA-binding transcriptional regulator AlpA
MSDPSPLGAGKVVRMSSRQKRGQDGSPMPRLLDVHEVANLMNVDVTTVLGWRRRNVLPPPIVVGRVVRWALSDLCDWIETRKEVR